MRAPVLAVGDGALGFWNGLREVFPQAREGRCWFHKTANVLAALPKSAHPAAKKALAEIWGAEDKPHALAAVKAFEAAYGAKFPKATAKITDDVEELLAFYDYPAEHSGPSAHDEPDRVDLRDGPAPDQGHQGSQACSISSSNKTAARIGSGSAGRLTAAQSGGGDGKIWTDVTGLSNVIRDGVR
jgi:hypothetical protein